MPSGSDDEVPLNDAASPLVLLVKAAVGPTLLATVTVLVTESESPSSSVTVSRTW